MTKRIDKLTPEQQAMIPAWRDRWIEIGLRTGESDRPRFEAAIVQWYDAAKLPQPKRIVWTTSPLALSFAAPTAAYTLALRAECAADVADVADVTVRDVADVTVRAAVSGAVSDAVSGAVGDADVAVCDAVRDAVSGAVSGAVDDAVSVAARDAVSEVVSGAVDDAVGVAVGDAVRDAVDAAVDDAVDNAARGVVDEIRHGVLRAIRDGYQRRWGGQFWAAMVAWRSFFFEACGLDLDPLNATARAWIDVHESACWFWPHRDFVMVCARPVWIDRDAQGRLHSESRMAICWPDGWGLYMWHGVPVASDVILHPERTRATLERLAADLETACDYYYLSIERRDVVRRGIAAIRFAAELAGVAERAKAERDDALAHLVTAHALRDAAEERSDAMAKGLVDLCGWTEPRTGHHAWDEAWERAIAGAPTEAVEATLLVPGDDGGRWRIQLPAGARDATARVLAEVAASLATLPTREVEDTVRLYERDGSTGRGDAILCAARDVAAAVALDRKEG